MGQKKGLRSGHCKRERLLLDKGVLVDHWACRGAFQVMMRTSWHPRGKTNKQAKLKTASPTPRSSLYTSHEELLLGRRENKRGLPLLEGCHESFAGLLPREVTVTGKVIKETKCQSFEVLGKSPKSMQHTKNCVSKTIY